MGNMEHAIEQVANALHGDQCAEDPDLGERCNCGADDFYRQAEIALDTLREAGLLAPAPLREEWGTRFGGYVVEGRTDAEYPFFWKGVPPPGVNVHRYRTDWLPADGISRAEGDGRAEP